MSQKPKRNDKPQSQHAIRSSASMLQIQSGPLPSPDVLAQYNQVLPGAAERIIRMAEDQQAHRFKMETKVAATESRNSTLGIATGFIIGMTTIIGGIIGILYGKELSGLAFGGTGLVSLVGVFIYGTRSRRKERELRFGQLQNK